MDTPGTGELIKVNIAFLPRSDIPIRGEWLWARWLDRGERLVLAHNNAFHVPLAVNDVVRVAPTPDGRWRAVELVRVTESVVSFTSFEAPITTQQGLATYDRWREEGHAIHTEGNCAVIMSTAWREFLTLEEVLTLAGPDLWQPGWRLWELYEPDRRRADIEMCVRFQRGRPS